MYGGGSSKVIPYSVRFDRNASLSYCPLPLSQRNRVIRCFSCSSTRFLKSLNTVHTSDDDFQRRKYTVMNLARQAPWHQCRGHSHPCCPVARPRFRRHSCGHPPCLGTSTDLRHIALVAISLTAGQSRPLSFVSVMLLVRPSPVRYVCCLPLIELARPSPMFVTSIVFP